MKDDFEELIGSVLRSDPDMTREKLLAMTGRDLKDYIEKLEQRRTAIRQEMAGLGVTTIDPDKERVQ